MTNASRACAILCCLAFGAICGSAAGQNPTLPIDQRTTAVIPFSARGAEGRVPPTRAFEARRRLLRESQRDLLGANQVNSTSMSENPIFYTAPVYGSGGYGLTSVAIADVDGDGKLDLVVTNGCTSNPCSGGGSVSVLLGNGDGTFKTPVSYSSDGNGPTSVVIADVNGDGKLDLVVANGCDSDCNDSEGNPDTDGNVAVLLGNGDGTFQPAVKYDSGGAFTSSVAVADVNGDGKPDLIVANECILLDCEPSSAGGVSVLLGNGDGTFRTAVSYSSGGQDPRSVAVADVNGDGKLDLLVANSCDNTDDCTNSSVGVLLGNGDGTFRTAVTYGSGGGTLSVAVADVNKDGKLDLLVANANGLTGVVGVLLGNGDGTFQAAVTYGSGGNSAFSVVTGDVNGDGRLDLVVANACDSDVDCTNGTVGVLLGNGDGTFQAAKGYGSGGEGARSVAVADVNGDKKLDVLVGNDCVNVSPCTSFVGVLLGNGDGTFQAPPNYSSGGEGARSVAVADVNGDGKLDLLVANECGNSDCSGADGTVGVLLGNGDGTFQAAVSYSSGDVAAYSVAVADVNGDGNLDLLVANACCVGDSTVGVLLGNGDGTFRAPVTYDTGGRNAVSVAVADVNGDGKLDLLLANECGTDICSTGAVGVLLSNGDGTFRAAVDYSSGATPTSVTVSDVNGDGKLDLLVANSCFSSVCAGTVDVLLGNGDGTFQPAVAYGSGGEFPSSVVVADVNGDGKLDLLVANYGTVGVLLGNGDGTFQTATATVIPAEGDSGDGSLAVADFNGDGKLDIAFGGVLLLGNGDGTFQSPLSLGAAGTGMVAGDFNGDGKPDLADAGVTVLLNIAPNFKYATTTVLSSSLNPVSFGHAVTFTASVKPSFDAGVLSGNVTFYDGTTVLGTEILSGDRATLTTAALAAGSHHIDAIYGGESEFNGSTALLLTQVVTSSNESFTPAGVAFEPVVIDTESENTRITFKHTGSGTITLTGITHSSHFSVNTTGIGSDACNLSGTTTLTKNQACVFNVAFSPDTTLGTVSGNVTAHFTGDPTESSIELPVMGTGTEVYLSTTTLPFGTVLSGTKDMYVRVTNKGGTALKFNGATITGTGSGQFTVLPYSAPNTSTCLDGPAILSRNQSCTISVRFTSTGAGTSYSETMSITHNGGASPQLVKITAED